MSRVEKAILASLTIAAAVVMGVTASLLYQAYGPAPAATPKVAAVSTAVPLLSPTGTVTAEGVYVTLAPGEVSPSATAGPTETPPLAIATETPVLAISSPTIAPTVEPSQVPIYVVQSGDTLFVIAQRFKVSLDDLKGVNGLTDNLIYPGQKLVIPVPGLVIPTVTRRPPTLTTGPGTAPPTATQPVVLGGSYGAQAIPGPSPTWSVFSFPTRFPATGPTKLGLHVTLNSGGALDYVAAVHPPVMKGVDDVGYLRDVKALSPNTLTLGRFVVDQPNIGQGDAAQRAIDFVNQMLPKYQANPWVDFWEGWNEVTFPNYEWYAKFEAARACEMQRLGFKAAIGGFSTGTPEPWQFEAFIPAIEAGLRCGAILTTHEYGAPTLYLWWSQGLPVSYDHPEVPAYPDRGPLLGRYRFLYYNMLLPRGLNIPLVISETGIDGGAGAGQRPGYSSAQGWMGFTDYWSRELGQTDGIQFYVEQLAWYDSMLRQDSFVIGATLFNVGNGATWASFEAAPIIPKLTEYALTLH